jgi:transposase
MVKESKQISGLTGTIIQKSGRYFSEAEKHLIIQELLSTGCSKAQIWEKYTGQVEEHGQLLRWMRKLGYDSSIKTRRPNFDSQIRVMTTKNNSKDNFDDFEILQLKKRIADLEKKLKDADMKAIAYATMVDVAEKEFNIRIKKKYNTKP